MPSATRTSTKARRLRAVLALALCAGAVLAGLAAFANVVGATAPTLDPTKHETLQKYAVDYLQALPAP